MTIDGTTLELAGEKTVHEVTELIRKGALEGDEKFQTVTLQAARADIPSSLPTTVYIKTSRSRGSPLRSEKTEAESFGEVRVIAPMQHPTG